jgi:hypothetical protein
LQVETCQTAVSLYSTRCERAPHILLLHTAEANSVEILLIISGRARGKGCILAWGGGWRGGRRGDVSTIPDATLRIQFSCRSGTVASRGRPRHVTLLLYGAKIHPEQSCIAAGTLESLFLILHTARAGEREKENI